MAEHPDPDNRELLRQAMDFHQQGRLDQADDLYGRYLATEPEHGQALRLRGILARERGELQFSKSLLEQAAGVAVADAEPLSELALTLMAAGELDLAECALRDAIARDNRSIKALANLAALLQHRGHVQESIVLNRRVIEIDPEDLEIRSNLAHVLVEAGQGDEAVVECDAALEQAPGHPFLLASKGAVLCGLERYEAATAILEQAVTQNSGDDMALTNLGYARLRLGDFNGAAQALERAVRINPDNARAASDFVNVLGVIGRGDESLQQAEQFLTRHPGECMVTAAYAYALRDQGRVDAAAAIFNYEDLVRVFDIDAPVGYADIESFNAALAAVVTNHDSLHENPVSKATIGGGQTGELSLGQDPALTALQAVIDSMVATVATDWSHQFPDHPVMASASSTWNLRCWGTVLHEDGRQLPHMHPLGWLSGVYYAELPDDMEEFGSNSGWIEFGQPPDRYRVSSDPVLFRVKPQPGRLVIFPSYFLHRTLPFRSASDRVSLAFDVMPKFS